MTKRTGVIWAAGLLLVVMTAAAYLPATRCGFIWDDDYYVQDNQTLRSADGLRRIWLQIGATPQYYPMVHTTYWLEYRLWKLDPRGYHVVNILLHAVVAVLLWRVLTILQVPGAWAAAALFALHPVHVESVAWITERKNVLSGVFYLSAALAYLRYAPAPKDGSGRQRSGSLYAASLVLFICALLSKTVTCTLPAVLLLVLWWKRERVGRADIRALAPFFALGVALGLVTIWMEKGHVGAAGEEWDHSLVDRCLIAGRVLCFYTGKLFWPAGLTFFYPRWQIDAHNWQQYVYPLAVIGVIAGLWLARKRTGKGPLVAVLCFAGTLFPALGFFDVFPMRYSYVADHFQYLAGAGLISLIAAVVYVAAGRLGGWGKGAATVVLALVLATLGTLTWRQCHIYKNLETLWRDTLRKNPDAWMAHNNLGTVLQAQGKLDEAISHYLETLRVVPGHPEAHYNLGNVLRAQGKVDQAIRHYRHVLRIKPDFAKAHYNLGVALGSQDKLDEAISHYRQALQIKPDFAKAHYSLGNALAMTGRLEGALEHFREALRLVPDYLGPMHGLARILATHPDPKVRRPDEAIRLAERAAELTQYQNAVFLDTLAAAYAAAGRFDQAVKTAQGALALIPDVQTGELADGIRARVELYKQARPYREPAPAP